MIEQSVLELKNPNLDLVQVSYMIGPEIYHLTPSGDQFPYSRRDIDHRYFRFQLKHSLNRISALYIYVDNLGDQLFIPIEVSTTQELDKEDYYLQHFNGFYFGVVAFVFMLNLFMLWSFRERSNLYYLLYLLGLVFLQLSLEGYGFEFLWPKSVYLANHMNPVAASFSVFFLLLFCREFLSLKTNLPVLNKIFGYAAVLLLLTFILAIPNIEWTYQNSILSINTIAFLLNVVIIPIGILLWKRGFKAARFFVIAFVVLVMAVFLFILRNFGLIPNNLITEKSLMIGSAFEVVLLSLAVVDRFRFFKDQAFVRLQEINEMKSKANIELEIKVEERTRELKEQKDIVEIKNHEITESIEYAKRIQNGLLPSDNLFHQLFQGGFVFYLPKDIVSGDFYWTDNIGKRNYIAAVDCTGHGVPGAMVSVMGFNHLNRCMKELGLTKPGEILDKLSELMVDSFQKSDLTIYDGMDIALCCLDTQTGMLEYAGANNPLYIISRGELNEVKATKKPIGRSDNTDRFVNHSLQLKKGDSFYIFSDGFADQFGGPKNKKFKYKDFKNLLLEVSGKAPEEQKEVIVKAFNDWKGINAQLDDVCVIGVRF